MPTSLYKTTTTDGLHSPTDNQQLIESNVNSYPIVIITLGHFSIYKYGQLINTHGNSQHKPSELLKLVIALGSRSVGEVRINDALWPDADGDGQRSDAETDDDGGDHQSLGQRIHRLSQEVQRPRPFLEDRGDAVVLISQ